MRALTTGLCFTALLLGSGASFAAEASKPARILVTDMTASDEQSRGEVSSLSELVATELSREDVTVLGTRDVVAMLGVDRQRQLLNCSDDGSCYAEIGAAMGAQYLVVSHLGRVSSSVRLDIKLIDNRRSLVVAREGVTARADADLLQLTQETVARLVERAPQVFRRDGARGSARRGFLRTAAPWVLVGAGTAATVVGGGMVRSALAFNANKSDLSYSDAEAQRAAALRRRNLGVGLVGAGTLALAGGVAWLLWPDSPAEPSPTVGIAPADGGLRLSFAGRW